jgi:hypothetical protein
MKALRTTICTYAVTLLTSLGLTTTSLQAGSGDFAGIYGAFNASAGGAQISGTHTDSDNQVNEGTVGGVYPLAGYEVGFNLPLGPFFFLGAGHSWTVGGTAALADSKGDTLGGSVAGQKGGETQDGAGSSAFHLKASNLKEVYIMPSVSIYDNSAVYVKLGRSIADLTATGNVTGNPGNLTGDTLGVGTIAMTESGIFIKTEGSVTRFNDITIVGVGGTTGRVDGEPQVVAGTVAIGFKF